MQGRVREDNHSKKYDSGNRESCDYNGVQREKKRKKGNGRKVSNLFKPNSSKSKYIN